MTLELTIKVTMILLAVALGGVLLRRSSAAARHLVQVLGLIAVLALPVAAMALPAWQLPVLAPPELASVVSEPPVVEPPLEPVPPVLAEPVSKPPVELPVLLAVEPPTPPSQPEPMMPETSSDDCPCAASPLLGPGADDQNAVLLAASAAPSTPAQGGAPAPPGWLVWLWAAGAAAVLARLGVGWWRMTRTAIDARPMESHRVWELIETCCARLGVRTLPRVLTSRNVRVPVLWGFAKPTLLLPAEATSWPHTRLRVVLLHEFAHLRRRDGLALLLGRLSAAIWWFNPLVWFVEGRARRDCERACDDIVLACGERPSTYARHLLDIAEGLPDGVAVPALAVVERDQLGTRVRSILRPDVRRGLTWRGAVTALAFVVVALVSVSSAQLVARAAERPEVPTSQPESVFVVETDRAGDSLAAAQWEAQWAVRVDDRGEDAIMLAHDGSHAGEDAFERAYELHGEERWDEAAAAFLEAADAGYRQDVSLYNAACGYARMGDTGQAIDLIERALEAGFDSFELIHEDSDLDPIRRDAAFQSMMERVGEEHRVGRYDGAVERYDDLVAQDSTDGDAWYEVGTTLLSLRDFERSIDALGRAVDNREAQANALYNTACAYSLKGDTNQGLDYLKRAVLAGFDSDERFENDSDLDNIRGKGRFDEIESLHDTLSLDRFRNSWGNWHSEYSSRRWEPAVDEFTAFVAKNPDVGRGWFNLGWALHHSRQHAEAREAFLKQLDLGYQPRIATYNVACTYAMEGQTDAAFEWLERAVDEYEMSAHQLVGDEDLESLHDDPRFEELLERAVENDDDFGLHRKHEKFFFKWREKHGQWKEKEKKRETARMY